MSGLLEFSLVAIAWGFAFGAIMRSGIALSRFRILMFALLDIVYGDGWTILRNLHFDGLAIVLARVLAWTTSGVCIYLGALLGEVIDRKLMTSFRVASYFYAITGVRMLGDDKEGKP